MFLSQKSPSTEFGLDANGGLGADQTESGRDFCEAILTGKITLEQANTLLAQAAVDKSRGNLSAAARMFGLTRPQLTYRLSQHQEKGRATCKG